MAGFFIVSLLVCVPLISIAASIWLVISLIAFLRCPKERLEERKQLRRPVIIAGSISFVFIAVFAWMLWTITHIMLYM